MKACDTVLHLLFNSAVNVFSRSKTQTGNALITHQSSFTFKLCCPSFVRKDHAA